MPSGTEGKRIHENGSERCASGFGCGDDVSGDQCQGQEAAAPAASPAAQAASVKCVGGNDCKGKSACKGASNDCSGQNGCKGKGFVMTSNADECKSKGGHVEGM